MALAPGSGYDKTTGIYHSKLPDISLPIEPCLGLGEHCLSLLARRRHRVALIDGISGWKLTYGQLEERTRALASGLLELGIQKGNVVLILSPNHVDYVVIALAVVLVGAVVTTANPSYTGPEVERQCRHSGATLVFSTSSIVERLWSASSYLSSLRTVLIGEADDKAQSKTDFPRLSGLLRGNAGPLVLREPVYQDDTAFVMYSSGTTGLSKGVVITHRNIIASTSTYARNPVNGLTEDDVNTCVIPQFHVFGLVVITLASLCRGAAIVVLRSYSLETLLRAVQVYRITHLPIVPPILLQLASQTKETLSKYDMRSLKQISSGAAPLHRTSMERCTIRFPGVLLQQGFGMTETAGLGTATPAVGYRTDYFGSAGILASNMQAKVVHVDSKLDLPPTYSGELWLRGPNIMKGYLNNERETAETVDSEGWLRTGDVVYFNEDGYMFVVDRIKELIKYNGFQVAPAELEALLLNHSQIQDAAVVAYPDKAAGEVPLAFVVRRPSSSLREEDVKSYVAGQVASFKQVRKVLFVGNIPKSPAGKILRRQLIQFAVGTPRPASKL